MAVLVNKKDSKQTEKTVERQKVDSKRRKQT